jgi:S1-C subfamily serine protease
MKALSRSCRLLIAGLLCGVPTLLPAQEAQPVLLPTADDAAAPFDSRQGRTIGAPQVLEIPVQDMASSVTSAPQPQWLPPVPERALGMGDPNDGGPRPEATAPLAFGRRNYLGVLYATAEEGPVGVKVLSVVEGSPAARAGFQGVNSPSAPRSDLLKAAIVVLAMSPAGPFAIPLAIAHDIYTNKQSPGDLIVAVDDQPVRDAQEFSEIMRHYEPGETALFGVMRGGKPLKIAVQLEEEPS